MIRSLDMGPLETLIEAVATLPPRALRGKLRDFARDHGVAI